MLYSVSEVNRKIAIGKPLLLAGSEEALSQLIAGNWIGGTIPYFMDAVGGTCSESQIFVTDLPDCAVEAKICEHTLESLPDVLRDAPEDGVSFIIIPAGSAVHKAYAQNAPFYDGMFTKPIVGWVSGVHLSRLGVQRPKVFNGRLGRASSETAVLMHVSLPRDKVATIEIVNVFKPGPGDSISFPAPGFSASDCLINGKKRNLAEYMISTSQDSRVPLTADYNGSIVNVSIQSVDRASGIVHFYAPAFPGIEYTFAAPVEDYLKSFALADKERNKAPVFSCNCILNYLYAGLEGKRTGTITGPITFGEIAHQLLNQTIVHLFIEDVC